MMEGLTKEKRKKRETLPDTALKPSILKPITKEPIVFDMSPEQEIILLKDLLGNFSDQTGACFG